MKVTEGQAKLIFSVLDATQTMSAHAILSITAMAQRRAFYPKGCQNTFLCVKGPSI